MEKVKQDSPKMKRAKKNALELFQNLDQLIHEIELKGCWYISTLEEAKEIISKVRGGDNE